MASRLAFHLGRVIGGDVGDKRLRRPSPHLVEQPSPRRLLDRAVIDYNHADAASDQERAGLPRLSAVVQTPSAAEAVGDHPKERFVLGEDQDDTVHRGLALSVARGAMIIAREL